VQFPMAMPSCLQAAQRLPFRVQSRPLKFQGWVLMLAFGLGASLPLLAVAYGSLSLFQAKRNWLAALSGKAKPIFGIVLIMVAVGIISGGDKILEAALLRHLPESWVDLTTRF
jgi:cytochrome c-type biogenesis protein